MASAAGGLVFPTIGLTIIVYLSAYFVLGLEVVPESAEGFDFILELVLNIFDILVLNSDEIPGWFSFTLFLLVAVPWTIIIMDVTGVVGDILALIGLGIGTLSSFLAGLF